MNTTPAFAVVTAVVSTVRAAEVTVMVGLTAGQAVRLVAHDDTTPIIEAVSAVFPRGGQVFCDGWEFSPEDDAKVRREMVARSRMAWEDNR